MTKRHLFANASSLGLFATFLLLAGCGTMVAYEGPTLPRDRIAILKSPLTMVNPIPGINCIDGKKATGTEIHVLPGKHTVEASLLYQPVGGVSVYRYFVGNLEFEAQAGYEYVAGGAVAGGQPLIWLENRNTNQIAVRGTAVEVSFKKREPCT